MSQPTAQPFLPHGLAFATGLVFGVGLLVAGMADPHKVLAFLNLAGPWDPSLAFVMGGAIGVAVFAFAYARTRSTARLGGPIRLPTSRDITPRLILGSVAFGVGWGLAGFCPAPALVALGNGQPKAVVFVVAMLVGMAAFEWLESLSTARGTLNTSVNAVSPR